MTSVPVIFFHRGLQKYLQCSVKAAQDAGNEVYLLGDHTNEHLVKPTHFLNAEKLKSKEYAIFKSRYKHMSTNSEEFEVRCFERYFRVFEYMKFHNLDKVVMLDSDVLTFVKFDTERTILESDISAEWQSEQLNYKWSVNPSVFAISIEAMRDFIDFLCDAYVNPSSLEALKQKWKYHQENNIPGGICDMTLLYIWINDGNTKAKFRINNNAEIHDDAVYDLNLQVSANSELNQFKFDRIIRLKIVKFVHHQPYFLCQSDGRLVQAKTLHFLGGAKTTLMSYYFQRSYITRLFSRYRLRIFSSPKLAGWPLVESIRKVLTK